MITTKNNLPFITILCACTMLLASESLGVQVTVSINPNPLNLGSQGVITCDVDLPEPYVFTDVNTATIRLEGISPESWGAQAGGRSFNCKFNRTDVEAYILSSIEPGATSIEMTIRFRSTDGTILFEGMDIVRFNLDDYTITATAGANGTINPSGNITISYGGSLLFTASADTGYHVDKWYVDSVEVQSGGTTYTLSNIQSNHTVNVTFTPIQYTVTASSGANGSISPSGSIPVNHGDSQLFTASADTGYNVDKWYVDSVEVQSGGTTYTLSNIQSNHTINVTFKPIQYTVTASSGANGSISPSGSIPVNHGDSLLFTAGADTGYHVDKWYVDSVEVQSGGTTYTLSNIQSNHTVNVTFTPIQYTVTASSRANGSISPSGSIPVNHGDSLLFTASADTGYHVDKWYVDSVEVQSGGTTYTLSNIQSNHTVNVTFTPIQYTVTASSGANGSISPSGSIPVNHGDSLLFTAGADIGYQVDKWYVDSVEVQTGGTTYTLSNIQSNHTINVTFIKVKYLITVSAGLNGSIEPSGTIAVDPGERLTLIADPDFSYEVDIWYVDSTAVRLGSNRYTLEDIQSDHTIYVTFRRMLSYALNPIEFDNENEFNTRVLNNNHVDSNNPGLTRNHVTRVVGQGPDPNGVMLMYNLLDVDPTSPTYGRIVHAHVKGIFKKTDSGEILIQFKYKFNTSKPGVKLIIYLSDSSTLWDLGDPEFVEHNIIVAELYAPPWPRAGSEGSGRFGIFEEIVSVAHLDFSDRVYVGLILYEPAEIQTSMVTIASSEDTSVMIDSWSPAVQCYGICLDINWDNFINEADFLTVISKLGTAATDSQACLEGVFGRDGTLDGLDVASWDWAMKSDDRLLNFCGVPLDIGDQTVTTEAEAFYETLLEQQYIQDLPSNLSDLLVLGKRGVSNAENKLKDRYYLFDRDGLFAGYSTPDSERCNLRLVKGPDGQLYLLNSETGLVKLDETDKVIIPPGRATYVNEPRYNKVADVYIGIQSEGWDTYGRPVLDAAFDSDYVYVLPVVVNPDGEESYTAAAQLQLIEGANPPYQVTRIYDDPPLEYDNQYRDNLREIEIDSSGNLYVLNVHSINESNILWKYAPDGALFERINLGVPDSNNFMQAPVGMCVSDMTNMLYMVSAMCDSEDVDLTTVYGFSTDSSLNLERSITIYGMQQVSSITEDPLTGSLWVAGFNMYDVPLYPNPYQPAFYYPFIAEIPIDSDEVQAISVYEPDTHDLALPTSIIWTGVAD